VSLSILYWHYCQIVQERTHRSWNWYSHTHYPCYSSSEGTHHSCRNRHIRIAQMSETRTGTYMQFIDPCTESVQTFISF